MWVRPHAFSFSSPAAWDLLGACALPAGARPQINDVVSYQDKAPVYIGLLLFAVQAWADEHPPTGDNPPITEDNLGGVQAGAIVEWLVLDPPIMTGGDT